MLVRKAKSKKPRQRVGRQKAKIFFKGGFTLIELLVVVAIIGILSTLLLANLTGMRSRARDAERKSDLKEIQKALELYKQDQSPWSYPAAASWDELTTALTANAYMKEVPNDPLASPATYYYSRTEALVYEIFACLENSSDPDKDVATQEECDNASYTLTEP